MQHIEEGTIHAWLDGALDAEESARVEQHVAECAACASAVAEARGLVAGASRILAALDDVPSGVLPRSGGGGSNTQRRPRSVWTYLHMTPARAAAAAFLIVAAGTALVMRQASSVARRGVFSMASQPKEVAAMPPVPVPRGAAVSGVVKAAVPAPSPPPLAAAARNDVAEKRSVALTQVTASTDSTAMRDAIAKAPARAPAPSAAPSAARAVGAARRQSSYAGCYSVVGDSLSALPKRLSLDSVGFDRALAGQFSVSALTEIGRRPIDSASWQPRPDGVLISFGRTAINLSAAADSTLSAVGVGGRGSMMTLQRVDCPR